MTMSVRVSGLGANNPRAEAAFRHVQLGHESTLDISTLCLARAYAAEVLRDTTAVERVNAIIRASVLAVMPMPATAA
jgi:hypothetical protein